MAGRSLLQEDTIKMNDATDKIVRAQQQLSGAAQGYIVNRAHRGLLQRPDNMKMWDAVDTIRQTEQNLERNLAGRGRVLMQEDTIKMNDASNSVRQAFNRIAKLGSRSARTLLEGGHGGNGRIDRMSQNTIKVNAAADMVAQATSKIFQSVNSRINASEQRNTNKAATSKAN